MVLEFNNVSHVYASASGTVSAVDNISLKIEAGEFFCLLGPSGCGKSTLLNMAAGFLEPGSGTVKYKGCNIKGAGRTRAVVFQSSGLFPWLNVEQNIQLAIDKKTENTDRKIDEALEIVGLKGFHKAMPHELSGGMKQKASIARAVAMDSDLLLMDEPFASLDEQTRFRLNREMVDIWRKSRKTVFFITHSIQEAIIMGSRLNLMSVRPGKITREWVVRDKGLSGEQRLHTRLDEPEYTAIASDIRDSMELCCPPGQPCRC